MTRHAGPMTKPHCHSPLPGGEMEYVSTTTVTTPAAGMTRTRTIVFAIAGGLAVGNLYWAQPLIEEIAGSLGVASSSAAALVTVTQIGYALGIFLVVPLGDVLNRRRLIPAVLGVSSVMLLGAAAAPSSRSSSAPWAAWGSPPCQRSSSRPWRASLRRRSSAAGWSERSPQEL